MKSSTLRWILAGMMFLEYAVWGAWMPVLSGTLSGRGLRPDQISVIYAMLWAGCLLAPFIGGQLADRRIASQWFLAISHFLAAGVAFWMAIRMGVKGLTGGMLLWAILFAPTLAVTNSVAFFHIAQMGGDEKSREKTFTIIRTAGSLGWIVAAFLRFGLINILDMDKSGRNGPLSELILASVLGLAMAVYCGLVLPATPPVAVATGEATDPLAFRKAFGLFQRVPGFTIFMVISFIAATEFQFFYLLSAPFLESLHVPNQYVPIVKSISQVTEIVALAVLLPLFLPTKGMKWCLMVGSYAWPLRYLIFAIGGPVWLVVASLGLHGFGYAFVLVVQQLYVERVAPHDVRASAQSLLNVVTLGFGNLLGSLFCGAVQQQFTGQNGITNWPPVFLLPAVLTLLCALGYHFTFVNPRRAELETQTDTGLAA